MLLGLVTASGDVEEAAVGRAIVVAGILLVTAVVSARLASAASGPLIVPLGVAGNGEYSLLGISADGSVVVGGTGPSYNLPGTQPFRWTQQTGLFGLGNVPGGSGGYATGVSADGSVIVGTAGSPFGQQAFRWTQATGMVSISPSAPSTVASGVSADGSTVVGTHFHNIQTAYRWNAGEGLIDLNLGFFIPSSAAGVSADGSVIVGSKGDFLSQRAFRWTAGTGGVDLGVLGVGFFNSAATAVTPDGSFVVGQSSGFSNTVEPFRWTSDSGMVGLGFLSGSSNGFTTGVSADGQRIVGYASDIIDGGFIWDPIGGMRSAHDFLAAAGVPVDGWNIQSINAVSADGTTFAGYGSPPNRNPQLFVAIVPEPGTIDLASVGIALFSFTRRRRARPSRWRPS